MSATTQVVLFIFPYCFMRKQNTCETLSPSRRLGNSSAVGYTVQCHKGGFNGNRSMFSCGMLGKAAVCRQAGVLWERGRSKAEFGTTSAGSRQTEFFGREHTHTHTQSENILHNTESFLHTPTHDFTWTNQILLVRVSVGFYKMLRLFNAIWNFDQFAFDKTFTWAKHNKHFQDILSV